MAHSIFRKSRHTLLLVTRSHIARIDLTGRRKLNVKQCWSEQRDSVDSLTTSLTRAAKLGPKSLGRLTVLHTDFWTEILGLPVDVATIATPQELRNALAIEAEIESGIAAFESQVACLPLKSPDNINLQFCTTVIEKSRVAELSRFATQNHTKLHCLAHPAAVELTQEITSQDAAIELNRWTGEISDIGASLERFAQRACGSLEQLGERSSLSVLPESQGSKQLAVTIGLAVLGLSGCISWNLHTRQVILGIHRSIDSWEQLEKQQSQLAAEIKRTESKLVALTQDTQKTNSNRRSIETQLQSATEMERMQNSRWTKLLAAISENAADCWVQGIESDVYKTTILGLAINNAEANKFAAKLEQSLKSSGWAVSPAATQLTESDLYEFRITVKPTSAVPKTKAKSNEIVSSSPSSTAVKESFQ